MFLIIFSTVTVFVVYAESGDFGISGILEWLFNLFNFESNTFNTFDCAQAFEKRLSPELFPGTISFIYPTVEMYENKCWINSNSWVGDSIHRNTLWNMDLDKASWMNQVVLGETCFTKQCDLMREDYAELKEYIRTTDKLVKDYDKENTVILDTRR